MLRGNFKFLLALQSASIKRETDQTLNIDYTKQHT